MGRGPLAAGLLAWPSSKELKLEVELNGISDQYILTIHICMTQTFITGQHIVSGPIVPAAAGHMVPAGPLPGLKASQLVTPIFMLLESPYSPHKLHGKF